MVKYSSLRNECLYDIIVLKTVVYTRNCGPSMIGTI